MANRFWLLLLHALPAGKSTVRVQVWRSLKKLGAIPLKSSGHVMPDSKSNIERLSDLAARIRQEGGKATVARVSELEGISDEDLIAEFNEARTRDYLELLQQGQELARKRKNRDELVSGVAKLRERLDELQSIDFFSCPTAQNVREILQKLSEPQASARSSTSATLSAAHYQNKTWLTRPRPGIDRVGSAWLISRFIDPGARFVFDLDPASQPDAIAFDLAGAEFTHEGDRCTFETFVSRFGFQEPPILEIAQAVHDADFEDGRFARTEGLALDKIFKGWAAQGLSDLEILQRGRECFEGLYAHLRNS